MDRSRKTALFISIGSSMGGASQCLLENVRRIDRALCRVVVVLPDEGPLTDLLRESGIECKIIPISLFYYCSQVKTCLTPRNLGAFLRVAAANVIQLRRLLREYRPDVVVVNTAMPLLSGLLARLMKQRVIWHVREVLSTEPSALLKGLIARTIRFSAEAVVCASEYSRRDLAAVGLGNGCVIYDGAIDLRRFRVRQPEDSEFSALGLKPGEMIVGFVGQIYKEKGIKQFLEAAFLLTARLPEVKFLVVGSSSLTGRQDCPETGPRGSNDLLMRQIVAEMRLERNFVFTGQRFDVERLLPLMRCLVFSPLVPEVFGRVMVEAMACGVPVAASARGAVPEIVVCGKTGVVVKPDSPKELAAGLAKLLTDPAAATRMGQAARRRAEEYFDIEKIMPQLLQIYLPAVEP